MSLILNSINILEETNKTITLANYSDFLASIAAVANVLIVFWIYRKDKKERKIFYQEEKTERDAFYQKEKNEKINRQEIEKKSFWYRNLVLERKIDVIECFFKDSIKLFEELESGSTQENQKRKKVFQENRRNLICQVNDYVRFVSNEFGEYLDEQLDECEDLFTDSYDEINKETVVYKKKVIVSLYQKKTMELNNKFLRLLYNFELFEYDFNKLKHKI